MFRAKGIKPIEKDINTPEVKKKAEAEAKKKAEAEVKKKVEGNDDKTDHSSYWINLNKMSDTELKNQRIVIRKNALDKPCKAGSEGDIAKQKVLTRLL